MIIKRITALIVSILLVFSASSTAIAADNSISNSKIVISRYNYSVNEVKQLEPYVYVEDNHFAIDYKRAVNDGVDINLIEYQQRVFDYLNSKEIKINDNMSFTIESPETLLSASIAPEVTCMATKHWYNCGGGRNTSTTNYWWGYARYACDCETNRLVADLNSAASVAAGAGVIGTFFGGIGTVAGGLSSAYWWLLSSRIAANNHGRGVYIEMTWVLLFDITPQ